MQMAIDLGMKLNWRRIKVTEHPHGPLNTKTSDLMTEMASYVVSQVLGLAVDGVEVGFLVGGVGYSGFLVAGDLVGVRTVVVDVVSAGLVTRPSWRLPVDVQMILSSKFEFLA